MLSKNSPSGEKHLRNQGLYSIIDTDAITRSSTQFGLNEFINT